MTMIKPARLQLRDVPLEGPRPFVLCDNSRSRCRWCSGLPMGWTDTGQSIHTLGHDMDLASGAAKTHNLTPLFAVISSSKMVEFLRYYYDGKILPAICDGITRFDIMVPTGAIRIYASPDLPPLVENTTSRGSMGSLICRRTTGPDLALMFPSYTTVVVTPQLAARLSATFPHYSTPDSRLEPGGFVMVRS